MGRYMMARLEVDVSHTLIAIDHSRPGSRSPLYGAESKQERCIDAIDSNDYSKKRLYINSCAFQHLEAEEIL